MIEIRPSSLYLATLSVFVIVQILRKFLMPLQQGTFLKRCLVKSQLQDFTYAVLYHLTINPINFALIGTPLCLAPLLVEDISIPHDHEERAAKAGFIYTAP